MIMGFNYYSAEIPFLSNEDVSSEGNVVADEYFLSEPESSRAMILVPTLVLPARVPQVQRRDSN